MPVVRDILRENIRTVSIYYEKRQLDLYENKIKLDQKIKKVKFAKIMRNFAERDAKIVSFHLNELKYEDRNDFSRIAHEQIDLLNAFSLKWSQILSFAIFIKLIKIKLFDTRIYHIVENLSR